MVVKNGVERMEMEWNGWKWMANRMLDGRVTGKSKNIQFTR
jgi:hypothetical protein